MNKRTIGLITWLGNGNYGTTLQAYALYHTLEKLGYCCYHIDDFPIKSWKLLLKYIMKRLGLYKLKHMPKEREGIKYDKLDAFKVKNFKELEIQNPIQKFKMLKNIDIFCVGSDQIWNSYYSKNIFALLPFAGHKKCISYASSIGTKDIALDMRKIYRRELLKFKHLSLREEIGRKVIAELTGRDDVHTVLDPTFLLTAEQWLSMSKDAEIEFDIPDKFILCYLIGSNNNYHAQIRDLQHRYGIDTIIYLPAEEYWNFNIKNAIRYEDAGVKEFIFLLHRATLVCTDSYHATAISINMQKKFVEFLRFKEDDGPSQNSRIYDLLNKFHLQDRLYNKDNDAWVKSMDYAESIEILVRSREESFKYLINALEN